MFNPFASLIRTTNRCAVGGRLTLSLGITFMSLRSDISDKVIHFTKGKTAEEALENLLCIVGENILRGGNGMIKGGYNCVCFTEAPLPVLANGLVRSGSFTRYSPFGLMFEKKWLYRRGARPVIYQPDSEFSELHEDIRWRHVRYEPDVIPPVDFTWEREWRIRCDELSFTQADVAIIVPDKSAEDFIREIWKDAQQYESAAYSVLFDETFTQFMEEEFPWRITRLS